MIYFANRQSWPLLGNLCDELFMPDMVGSAEGVGEDRTIKGDKQSWVSDYSLTAEVKKQVCSGDEAW